MSSMGYGTCAKDRINNVTYDVCSKYGVQRVVKTGAGMGVVVMKRLSCLDGECKVFRQGMCFNIPLGKDLPAGVDPNSLLDAKKYKNINIEKPSGNPSPGKGGNSGELLHVTATGGSHTLLRRAGLFTPGVEGVCKWEISQGDLPGFI